MSTPTPAKLRFLIAILLMLLVSFGLVASLVWPWLNHPTRSYREAALLQVDTFLQVARQYPFGEVPDTDTHYAVFASIGKPCWSHVQGVLARNRTPYMLEVVRYDDSRRLPYPVHDTIEIVIHAVFSDQSRLEFVYFQGGISGCRSIPNAT